MSPSQRKSLVAVLATTVLGCLLLLTVGKQGRRLDEPPVQRTIPHVFSILPTDSAGEVVRLIPQEVVGQPNRFKRTPMWHELSTVFSLRQSGLPFDWWEVSQYIRHYTPVMGDWLGIICIEPNLGAAATIHRLRDEGWTAASTVALERWTRGEMTVFRSQSWLVFVSLPAWARMVEVVISGEAPSLGSDPEFQRFLEEHSEVVCCVYRYGALAGMPDRREPRPRDSLTWVDSSGNTVRIDRFDTEQAAEVAAHRLPWVEHALKRSDARKLLTTQAAPGLSEIVRDDLKELAQMVRLYEREGARLQAFGQESLSSLAKVAPWLFLVGPPYDPWGSEYRIQGDRSTTSVRRKLLSAGPDRHFNTSDDLTLDLE